MAQALLDNMGLELERFRLVWRSSAKADRFATSVRKMTQAVKDLGLSPYNTQAEASASEGAAA